jgi:phage tail-like protein
MPAPLFTVNAHRFDPYRTFKFQVIMDGKAVAGLKKMSALKKSTEFVKWRNAGDPYQRIMPGLTTFEQVTLEQGLTHDPVFENWANLVNNVKGDAAMSLKNYRKDLVVNLLNLQGNVAMSYKLFRSWVSSYQAIPDLDAGTTNSIGIQSLTLQVEYWEHDLAVPEPVET